MTHKEIRKSDKFSREKTTPPHTDSKLMITWMLGLSGKEFNAAATLLHEVKMNSLLVNGKIETLSKVIKTWMTE